MLPSTVYCDNCGAVNRPQAQFCVACGQALASASSASRTQAARPWLPTGGAHMVDRVGQHLGNYRLNRLLGKGGFAEVYLGEHIYLETQAAIKVLLTQLADEDIEPFRLEAKRVAHLEHPHIVRVLEFGVDGTTPYLVMSYAPNGTLRERHPKGVALPFPIILGYVKQAAEALQYAHDEHFVHRDVKPENLLIGRRQEVLLSDFGIALLTQTSRSQSMQDVAGTASYMAPEQFQGKPRPASDQYSLGIVVYEWLTGDRPFHGSFTEIASQHLFVPPPPLHERMLTISPAVEQVVLMALAKDPKQRFASILAFATALEQASQAEASQTLPASRSLPPTDAMTQLRPSQPAAELTTLPSKSAIPTELITPENRSSSRTELSTPQDHISSPTEAFTPSYQASLLSTEPTGSTLLPQTFPAGPVQPDPPVQPPTGPTSPTPPDAKTFAPGTQHKTKEQWISEGKALHDAQRYQQALEAYDQAIRLDPYDGDSYRLKGIIFGNLNRDQEALGAYDQAIHLNPNDTYAYLLKGIIFRSLNRYQETLAIVEQAIRHDPNNADAYNFKGRTLRSLKRYKEALAAYEKAIRLDPNNAGIYNNKSAVLDDLERYEEAFTALEMAIRLDPTKANDPTVCCDKGLILYSLERYQEALTSLDQATRLDPNNDKAYSVKGDVLDDLNKYQEALDAYEQAIRLNDKDASHYFNKGRELVRLKRYQEALAAYEQAIGLNPNKALYYEGKGKLLEYIGKKREAQQAYARARQLG